MPSNGNAAKVLLLYRHSLFTVRLAPIALSDDHVYGGHFLATPLFLKTELLAQVDQASFYKKVGIISHVHDLPPRNIQSR